MKANFESLYDHIGYLFYALATEQKPLSELDMKKLEIEISDSWQPFTKAESSLHYSFLKHLNNSINECFINDLSSNNAFEVFEDYYFIHRVNFGNGLQQKMLTAAKEISGDFFSSVKDEKGSLLIDELKVLFDTHLRNTTLDGPVIIYSYDGNQYTRQEIVAATR
jgi:hypothetical protein